MKAFINILIVLNLLVINSTISHAKSFKDTVTGLEMVSVKGGCFQMGDTFGDGESTERPVHKVCVGDFAIGKYEVTQGLWKRVMGNNPSWFSACGDDCPLENVSSSQVEEFIRKLNQRTGKSYRLPSEAEWEYAARSGGKKQKYSGGNNLGVVAWYADNSANKTHPVGKKKANGLGAYDMTGNVSEFCQNGAKRGGAYARTAFYCRSAYRDQQWWQVPPGSEGFRLVLSAGQ